MKWIGYNPEYPYWLLASCPFVAFGTGSLFTLMGSMISDVCDYDELGSNKRREGVFGAIYWWMVKVGMALAAFSKRLPACCIWFHYPTARINRDSRAGRKDSFLSASI